MTFGPTTVFRKDLDGHSKCMLEYENNWIASKTGFISDLAKNRRQYTKYLFSLNVTWPIVVKTRMQNANDVET